MSLDKTVFEEIIKARAEGYAACQADAVAWMEQEIYRCDVRSGPLDLLAGLERGEHVGAAGKVKP